MIMVTDCPTKFLSFSSLNRKSIQASFTGGDVGSDGGLLLLRETDKRDGFIKKISQAISDNRHPGYVSHSIEHLLRPRRFAIAAGYEDVNDPDQLRKESGFQISVGREVDLASSATLSRFENAVTREDIVNINKAFVEQFIHSHTQAPEQLVLDFDPTDHKLYGNQQHRYYHGYYRDYCY